MKTRYVSRRSFFQTATLGAVIPVAGTMFPTPGKADPLADTPNIFICSVCGHIEFGTAPDNCPVCHAPKEKFQQNNQVFAEAEAKNKEGGVKHLPVVLVKNSTLITEPPCQEVIVRVGKTLHPMEAAHHIRFIDGYIDDKYVARADLTPGIQPAACFSLKSAGSRVRIVEWCNLHSYWQAEAVLK